MSARPMLAELSRPPIQELGKYRIAGVLGEGAMGIVYDAIDPLIDRRVAVKAIRAPLRRGLAQDPSVAARFRTEAQAAGRLSHPNIVSIYEYGESNGEWFIAMEYVQGASLLDLIAQGRLLSLDDVASVMLQLLDALACAHEQGVWHRDIKPANLLITADGRLKVTDFGIARIETSDLTLPSSVLGSAGYMAPECYTAEAPDSRVDLYACGVLMYELLTGRRPYRGSNSQVMYQVLCNDPPAPSTLALARPSPRRLDAVVAQAMARDREKRFASAAQMCDALREAVGRPIQPNILARLETHPPAGADTAAAAAPVRSGAAPSTPAGSGAAAIGEPLLAAITALLLAQLGPVARLVVRDAARHSPNANALVARIAAEALDASERDLFIRRALALVPRRQAVSTAPPMGALPVLGSTPLTDSVVENARRLLAEHLGPIAGVIARRAAATATSREQFFATLVDQAGEDLDRKRLLARLWRIE